MTTRSWNERSMTGAEEGGLDLMREALQNGADVNTCARDIWGSTPFHKACRHGRLEAVQFLSSVAGLDLNAVTRNSPSAFHFACRCGHVEVVRFLVTLPGCNFLQTDDSGESGLHCAVSSGRPAVVQFLLSSNLGFDVEARCHDGWSAPLVACRQGRLEIVECLLTAQNADAHAVDGEGKSCLHLALDRRNMEPEVRVEVVWHLLASFPGQVSVAKTDNDGNAPFHCHIREFDTATMLLENGASMINAVNIRRSSPLHDIVGCGVVEFVEEFVQRGADLLAANEDGDTPFDLIIGRRRRQRKGGK